MTSRTIGMGSFLLKHFRLLIRWWTKSGNRLEQSIEMVIEGLQKFQSSRAPVGVCWYPWKGIYSDNKRRANPADQLIVRGDLEDYGQVLTVLKEFLGEGYVLQNANSDSCRRWKSFQDLWIHGNRILSKPELRVDFVNLPIGKHHLSDYFLVLQVHYYCEEFVQENRREDMLEAIIIGYR